MWSLCIVIDPLVFDDLAGLSEITEDVFVQAFISEPSVEAIDKGILHRLSRCDLVPADASVLTPSQHSMRSHFRSIVGDNHVRLAAPADQFIQFARHAGT